MKQMDSLDSNSMNSSEFFPTSPRTGPGLNDSLSGSSSIDPLAKLPSSPPTRQTRFATPRRLRGRHMSAIPDDISTGSFPSDEDGARWRKARKMRRTESTKTYLPPSSDYETG